MRARLAPLSFLLPALAVVGALILWPLVQTVTLSLTNYNPAVTVPLTTGLHIDRDDATGEVTLVIDRDSAAQRAGLTEDTVFEGLTIPPDPRREGSRPRVERFRGPPDRRLRQMRRALDRAEERALAYPPHGRRLTLFVAVDGVASREVVLPYEPAPVRRVPLADLGLDVAHISRENRWQLVVRPGLPADRAGITSGHEIVTLQGEALSTLRDLPTRLDALLDETQRSGEEIVFGIRRRDVPEAPIRSVTLPGHRGPFTLDPPPAADPETLSFVGLHNYARILLPDPSSNEARDFYRYLMHTVIWTVINVSVTFVIGLGLALLLNRDLRARTLYRVVLMLPWAVPVFVSAFVWRFLFNQQGIINAALGWVGVDPVTWLSSTPWTMTACIVVNVWLGVPFMMVVLLGGLQSIPAEMYEAARVDGATRWQQFRNVTMPFLRPVAVTATLLGVIWTFNMFNVIYLVQGREGRQVEILATLAFRRFYVNGDYGLAAAYGVVILVILLVFAFFYIRALRGTERIWQ